MWKGEKCSDVNIRHALKSYFPKASARLSIFSLSKLVVGSSKAKTPQLKQKVSASANLMSNEAKT